MVVDQVDTDGLPLWPAAERNKEPILRELQRILGRRSGVFVEIAAGTGQHAVHFAAGLPSWSLTPTDVDREHLATLRARVGKSNLSNLHPPLEVNVTWDSWPVERADVIYCANMVHIAPFSAAVGLFRGAGRTLRSDGLLITYGPYRFEGSHTAESNERFDQSLRERNPSWGVRDVEELQAEAELAGLRLRETVPLPANNFLLVWSLVVERGAPES